MSRTFEQVLAEVKTQSDPQRQIVLKSIADLPAQQAAEEASLAAKKDQAYTDILDGARRRGTGVAFGGIPLGEQAQYSATEYMPAVARMKTGFNDRRGTLENALAEMGKNEYSTAYNIYNADRQFAEQQRQFNEQLAESRRQAAASAAQTADLSKYFSSNTATNTVDKNSDIKNVAMASINKMLQERDFTPSMWNEIVAISKSASYGNKVDQAKLELLRAMRPGYFKNGSVNTSYITNLLNRNNTSNNGGGGGGW